MNKKELLEVIDSLRNKALSNWRAGAGSNLEKVHYEAESDMIEFIKSLIIQLDEPGKVVIPRFVADWWEQEGTCMNWWNWFYKWGGDQGDSRTELEKRTIEWMQDFNEGLFVDMFRYGYEIEKEPLYYTVDEKGQTLLFKSQERGILRSNGADLETVLIVYEQKPSNMYQLTEKEIKDYDPRYWTFAVPVEEEE